MMSRSQDGALLLGRAFVAALFLPSGFNHVMGFWSAPGEVVRLIYGILPSGGRTYEQETLFG
jgi:uncharacterized membrane protein YphA (DoxX/SURF4 family)